MVERMLLDAANIKHPRRAAPRSRPGPAHRGDHPPQARYALPKVVAAFKRAYPRVTACCTRAARRRSCRCCSTARPTSAVATEALAEVPELASFPYYGWQHAVVVPAGHPLEAAQPLTLEAIATHPLITTTRGFTGRTRIDQTFAPG